MDSPNEFDQLPAVLTIEEAARLLRLGRNTAYDAARSGELPVVRIGRRLLVPRDGLMRLLESAGTRTPEDGAPSRTNLPEPPQRRQGR
jgi:excisionase family DNA binding protein